MMHIQKVIRAGYKRHLGVGMFNLLSFSLSCRDSPMVPAHTAMPLSCAMHHAPCLPTDLLSATMKLGDYVGRGKRQARYISIISQFAPRRVAFTVIHYKKVSVACDTTKGGVATYLRNEPGKSSLFFLTAHHPRILHAWSLLGIRLRRDADACLSHRLSVRFGDTDPQFKRFGKDPQQRSWNPLVFLFFPRSSGQLILPGPQPQAHDIALPTLVKQ